jgi:diguanylate cyclase (GGDEF)-like protein
MVTAVIAAGAVLGACVLTLLAVRRANARSDRRLGDALLHIDRHLEAMSASVSHAVDTVVEAGRRQPGALFSLDFDELVEALVAEAAARTGADAVVIRIEGPGGRPVVRSVGAGVETEALDRSFAPPGGAPFHTAAITWTYSPVREMETVAFESALVTPLGPPGDAQGAVAAFAVARNAFRPTDAATVQALVGDMSVALANARRFSEVEAKLNVDPATGVPNRRGYELELGREADRAQRTGRPLSVILVGLPAPGNSASTADDRRLAELARLVTRVARKNDIACRRGPSELAILLPATSGSGAEALSKRLELEADHAFDRRTSAVTVGVVESLPGETAEALDARIEGTVDPPRPPAIAVLEDSRTASTASTSTVLAAFSARTEPPRPASGDVLRGDALEALASELVEARRFGRSLALVILDVDGVDEVDDDGLEDANTRVSRVAGRLDRSLGTGSVHRLGASEFALVLPGSGVDEAEALVDALQSSLEPAYDEPGTVLSAGVTEVAEGDDAQTALGRAEHALWQAKQAGRGTVVVAVPSRRSTPPR